MNTTDAGPKVRVQIVYNFGSNAEVSDAERGLAHAIEHMLFKGTLADHLLEVTGPMREYVPFGATSVKRVDLEAAVRAKVRAKGGDALEAMTVLASLGALHLSETDIDTLGRYYGASMNAFTSLDKTSYYFEMGKHAFEPFLNVFAASMKSSRLDEQHLRSEVLAVLNEMAIGNDNFPREAIGVLRQRIYAADEAGHYDTIGSEKDLLKLSAPLLRAFYSEHYQPWNATLYVVGDLEDPLAVQAQVTQLFGTYKTKEWRAYKEVLRLRGREVLALPPGPSMSKTTLYHDVPHATLLYAFRIGGNSSPSEYLTPKALCLGLAGTEHSRFRTGLVHCDPPLAHAVECFAEQYRETGEFYILITPVLDPVTAAAAEAMTSQGNDTTRAAFRVALAARIAAIEAVLSVEVARPWGGEETQTMQLHLLNAFEDRSRSLDALTNHWVDVVGCGGSPSSAFRPPTVVAADLDAFCRVHLRLDASQLAVIAPKAGSGGYDERCERRAALRQAMTDRIHATKARDLASFPLEEPSFAVSGQIPQMRSFRPDEFLLPAGASFALPSYPKREAVTWLEGTSTPRLALGLDGLRLSLAIAALQRLPSVRAQIQAMEAAGDNVSLGATGAAFGRRVGGNPTLPEYRALLHSACVAVFKDGTPAFVAAKAAMIQALRAQTKDSGACARHEARQRVLLPLEERWGLDEAVLAIEATTAKAALSIRETYWNHAALRHASVNADLEPTPRTSIAKGLGRGPPPGPCAVALPFATAQTTMVYARRGVARRNADTEPMVRLVEAIAFHSLGSRLYKIREKTGLFYSARGVFGEGAGTQGYGMDQITLRCKPAKVEEADAEIDAFVQGMREGTTPITEIELASAKAILSNRLMDRVQPSHVVGTVAAWHRTYGRPRPRSVADHVQALQAVTLRQINEASKRMFTAPFDTRVRAG